MKTTGNTILITGGSAGIGFGLAKKFSEIGNKVIITGRNEEKLKAAISQLNNASYIMCDQSKQNDLEDLLLKVQNEFPEVNILINNAGIQYNYSLLEESQPFDRIENEINIGKVKLLRKLNRFIPNLISKKIENELKYY